MSFWHVIFNILPLFKIHGFNVLITIIWHENAKCYEMYELLLDKTI
jgi:hypothetical protein